MTTQARSSYLPSEILWGHRFESLISFKKDSGEYEVDYAVFNNTIPVDTPLCSARQLDEHRAMLCADGSGKDSISSNKKNCFMLDISDLSIYVGCESWKTD